MEKTKIQLSPDELLLMKNSDWILTKNSVVDKISRGFGSMLPGMQQELKTGHLIDDSIVLNTPKISRGEKYEGLPYVILDYPRLFGKEHIVAIRTLFWWGNYSSITLHVKGQFQELISSRLMADYHQMSKSNFYLSFSGNEWNHDISNKDYTVLAGLSLQELGQKLQGSGFLKIAAKVEFGPWHDMEREVFRLFRYLANLLKA